jgi:hypothetical protein
MTTQVVKYNKKRVQIEHLASEQGVPLNSLKFRIQSGMTPEIAVCQARAGRGNRFAKCNEERLWLGKQLMHKSLKDVLKGVPLDTKEKLTILGIYGERKTRNTIAKEFHEYPYRVSQYEKEALTKIRRYHEPEWEPADQYLGVKPDEAAVSWLRVQIVQYGFDNLMRLLEPTDEELVVLAAYYMEHKTRKAVAGILRTPYVGKVISIEMEAIRRLQLKDFSTIEKKADLSGLYQ